MSRTESQLAHNYEQVSKRIEAACARSGRAASSVSLVIVTKYAEIDWVRTLVKLGATRLGENRPQQLLARIPEIPSPVEWHLIGHLQTNKVRRILPAVALIHSVDSLRLLREIERIGGELNLRPRILLEVNLTGEASKHGFTADELESQWDEVSACRQVQLEGLMTMAAFSDDPEESRPVFASLRELRDRLATRSPALALTELSMGMTGDFEVAIEEGATLVRIGSALFEGLSDGADGDQPDGP